MALNLLRILEDQENNFTGEYLVNACQWDEMKMHCLVQQYLPNLHITKVHTVHNNYLRAMYLLKKEEYQARYGTVTEKIMFHATAECNVESIVSNNLDWRRVSRNKFGSGVSFSEDADYANYYCNSRNGDGRVFIVAKVLVSHRCNGNANMDVPVEGTDTAIGNNSKVFVKFNDNEFFPLHVVYYNAPSKSTSKFYHLRYKNRRFH